MSQSSTACLLNPFPILLNLLLSIHMLQTVSSVIVGALLAAKKVAATHGLTAPILVIADNDVLRQVESNGGTTFTSDRMSNFGSRKTIIQMLYCPGLRLWLG